MRQFYKIDSNGYYTFPILTVDNQAVPTGFIGTRPPDGLYKAKFVNEEWVEGLSQAEIDTIKNTPVPLSDIDQLKKDQADLVFTLMMNGVL